MRNQKNFPKIPAFLRHYTILLTLIWTGLIGISLVWTGYHEYKEAESTFRMETASSFTLSVPRTPYYLFTQNQILPITLFHFIIWLLGISGIAYSRKRLNSFEGKLLDERELQNIQLRQKGEALIASESKYRHIFESFQDLYFQCDLNGTLEIISPSIKSLTGYTEEEIVGKSLNEIFSSIYGIDKLLSFLIDEGKVNNYELELHRKNGKHSIGSLNAQMIYKETGGPQAIEGVVRDISTIKQQEEKIHKVKILVAEDDAINQMVVTSMLERIGYSVDVVTNGKDAVQYLEHNKYDLVLMDCQMPEMEGYEATEEIRSTDSKVLNHRIPVIALTGHALGGDIEKCINAGINDYLSKPVKPVEMCEMIDKWLFRHEKLRKKHTSVQAEITGEELFDQSILMENLAEDKDLVDIILKDFCSYIPDRISALKKAYHNGDSSSVQHQAHTIKGSTANVGALSLQGIARQIEVAGEAGNLEGVELLLSQFDEGFAEFKKALARLGI